MVQYHSRQEALRLNSEREMTKSEMFKKAHAGAARAMAEQREIKHPSAHRSYRELFALCLRGAHLGDVYKRSGVEPVRYLWLRGM